MGADEYLQSIENYFLKQIVCKTGKLDTDRLDRIFETITFKYQDGCDRFKKWIFFLVRKKGVRDRRTNNSFSTQS